MAERTVPPNESFDIRARPVLLAVGGIVLGLVVFMAGLNLFYRRLIPHDTRPSAGVFPEPRLQTAPDGEADPEWTVEKARLAGYGWVDRGRGLVRIPIGRAMAGVVARGAAAFDPLPDPAGGAGGSAGQPAPAAAPPAAPVPQEPTQ